jgi:hypothetical protein
MRIAIEISQDDSRAAFHKPFKNRALIHAIATPGARDAQHSHLAHKAGQYFALLER